MGSRPLVLGLVAVGAALAVGQISNQHSVPSAEAAAADTCSNAEFRTGPGALLPNCRAYEQVSPVDKNGGDVVGAGTTFESSPKAMSVANDGAFAMFLSYVEFAGAESGGATGAASYLSQRGDHGWDTEAMIPAATPPTAQRNVRLSSPSLAHSLLLSAGVLRSTPPDAVDKAENMYLRDNRSGIVSPFIAVTAPPPSNTSIRHPVASPDLSHFVFSSAASDVMASPPAGLPDPPTEKLYEKVGGEVRLVSVQPDGTPFADSALPGGASNFFSEPYSTVGAVSKDGRHIFFNTGGSIFRRTDGLTTTLVSPSKSTAVDPLGPMQKDYKFASGDGSVVLFSSHEQLTDDANTGPGRSGSDLYRYDIDADELTDISATPVDGSDGAQVQGVLAASSDADRVYYVALGQVLPGEGIAGEPNLYLWEDDGTADGATRFVATLSAADSSNWFHLTSQWTARATPDGGHITFLSAAAIPGHDNGGAAQVYLYDAEAQNGAGDLTCVSCDADAAAAAGPAAIPLHESLSSAQAWELPRYLSEDGRRVFFNSPDALVTRDTNGEVDAYMWEDGEVSLLSTGQSSRESRFFNASANGDDVFILTGEALVAQDKDDLVDLYDVRVGGGFPAPQSDADCAGDECQGSGAVAPVAGGVGSAVLRGSGDVGPGPRATLSVRGLSGAQRARLAKGRRVGLRVRVSRAGIVRVVVRGRVGGRRRAVAKGSARASGPGSVMVRLRLTAGARRELKRAGAMRLSLAVRGIGAPPRSLSLRLSRAR